MFRFLIQFVALLVFFAVARSVLTWILRTAAASFRATDQEQDIRGNAGQSGSSELLASAGELYQDPVCGTFVPGSSNWTRKVDGQTLFFCSADCRDKFLVSARP